MSSKIFCLALCALLLALSFSVQAQQQAKVGKIGWLSSGGGLGPGPELFRREIRALGHIEGKNITVEYRYAENRLDRLPALADELVRLKVDVLVTPSTSEALSRCQKITFTYFEHGDIVNAAWRTKQPLARGTRRSSNIWTSGSEDWSLRPMRKVWAGAEFRS